MGDPFTALFVPFCPGLPVDVVSSAPSALGFFSLASLPGLLLAFLFLERLPLTVLPVEVLSVVLSDLFVLLAEVDGDVCALPLDGCVD